MDSWFCQKSELEHAKAAVGRVINQTVREQGLDCHRVAELLITECSAIEELLQQQLHRFTLATLLRYAGALNISLLTLDEALSPSASEPELQRGMA